MTVFEAIAARRTIRRFKQKRVPFGLLEKCVDAARLAPSASNRQRLEYIIVNERSLTGKIFEAVSWAGHLRPAWVPAETERPAAYIVMVADGPVKGDLAYDAGAAMQNILLTALEQGLGSCCLGSAKKAPVMRALAIPDTYSVALVIALGYPAESPRVDKFDGSIKYWRDEAGVLHVPKKSLAMVVHRGRWHKAADR